MPFFVNLMQPYPSCESSFPYLSFLYFISFLLCPFPYAQIYIDIITHTAAESEHIALCKVCFT